MVPDFFFDYSHNTGTQALEGIEAQEYWDCLGELMSFCLFSELSLSKSRTLENEITQDFVTISSSVLELIGTRNSLQSGKWTIEKPELFSLELDRRPCLNGKTPIMKAGNETHHEEEKVEWTSNLLWNSVNFQLFHLTGP